MPSFLCKSARSFLLLLACPFPCLSVCVCVSLSLSVYTSVLLSFVQVISERKRNTNIVCIFRFSIDRHRMVPCRMLHSLNSILVFKIQMQMITRLSSQIFLRLFSATAAAVIGLAHLPLSAIVQPNLVHVWFQAGAKSESTVQPYIASERLQSERVRNSPIGFVKPSPGAVLFRTYT